METEKPLYENTVIINPGRFFAFRKNKIVKLLVDKNKNIILQTEPQIFIPFNQIRSIKFGWLFGAKIKITLAEGKVYSIIWGSGDKVYSPMETADIFNNLKRIIK
jgi:hypothetical protein